MCAVQADAALVTVPGLPYPLAPKGMQWIGSVTPGSRNVTLYGTADNILSQLDNLKLIPEERWPLTTEAEERSMLPNTTGYAKRSYSWTQAGVDCNNAIRTAGPWQALEVIHAIVRLPGQCGSPPRTCTLMNSNNCAGIYFCNTPNGDTGASCLGVGLAGAAIMSCMNRLYDGVKGTAIDDRGWDVIVQSVC
ncbi:hypothetical protein VTL71DRAFT_7004 [Oculimacula yallundae]|uniref:Uncharacterized protein n=1 Tax=Oculimacula yallundae TaxID=86028 RepID=A0ABR4BVG4_9HELO